MTDMTTTTSSDAPAGAGGPLPLAIAAAQMLGLLQEIRDDFRVDLRVDEVDLTEATANLDAALRAATPIAPSPEGLWLAVRTSEQARATRRARKDLGRVSTMLGYERDRTERLRGTVRAQQNRIRDLVAGSTRTLHVAAIRLADQWEAEAGLARAALPADGDFDSAQCHLDGATEAYVDAAKQLRELFGRPVLDERPVGLSTYQAFRNAIDPARGARATPDPDDDVVDACIHAADCPGGECSCAGAQAERDAQLVANAEQLGDEIAPAEVTTKPDLIDGGDDRWRWVPAGYSRAVERPQTREEVDVNWGPVREVEPAEVPF